MAKKKVKEAVKKVAGNTVKAVNNAAKGTLKEGIHDLLDAGVEKLAEKMPIMAAAIQDQALKKKKLYLDLIEILSVVSDGNLLSSSDQEKAKYLLQTIEKEVKVI